MSAATGPAPVASRCSPSLFDSSGPGATVLGLAHFPGYVTRGWEQGDELQSEPRGNGVKFSKQALEIHGSDLVVLQVPRQAQRSVDLTGWGGSNSRFRSDTIRIELGGGGQCQGIWPGGFYFKRDQCLELNVKAGGRTATVPFGLGESCR